MQTPHFIQYLSLAVLFSLSTSLLMAQTPSNDTISIDFGSIASPAPWKNLSNPINGKLDNLPTQKGLPTSISIRIFDAFHKINTEGTTQPSPALGIPNTATSDSFFGNTLAFDGKSDPSGGVELMNLNPRKRYTIILFASRMANDQRETRYVIKGQNSDTLFLNTASNTSKTVKASLLPAADGTIRIIASAGSKNTSPYGFYYLGALQLVYQQDPTPPPFLALTAPLGNAFWQVGSTPMITWKSKSLKTVVLDYSTDFGTTWTTIDTLAAHTGKYQWTVPDEPSLACQVRLRADTLVRVTPGSFEIAKDQTSYPIVVLGSSTAAGQGVSTPDSSWVNRWRNHLNYDTRYQITNLAKGGYTTYHILPNGTPIPPTVAVQIDSSRNVSRALSLRPAVVFINMPSNDASYSIPVNDQLANFQLIIDSIKQANAQYWITTTQPRKFNDSLKVVIQKEMRDSILCIYDHRSVDFWQGIAAENGTILKRYNSGDYTHLNDEAHALLFKRILALDITPLEQQAVITNLQVVQDTLANQVIFTFEAKQLGRISIEVQNKRGNTRFLQQETIVQTGTQRFVYPYPRLRKNDAYMIGVVIRQDAQGREQEAKAAFLINGPRA